MFHLLQIPCSHFPSRFLPRFCCCRQIVVSPNHQVPQQNGPADGDFLSALLTGGGDSMSASPLWSPSPSDSGISEDPASDQMDSPQRPDSPSGDAQCFNPGPKSGATLGAGGCIDLCESHLRKQQQQQQKAITSAAALETVKGIPVSNVSSWIQAS